MKYHKIFYFVLVFVYISNGAIQASSAIQPIITITSSLTNNIPALYVTNKNNIDYFFQAHCYYTLTNQAELVTLYNNAHVRGWFINDSKTIENLGDVFLEEDLISASNYHIEINKNNELQLCVSNDNNEQELIHLGIVLPTPDEITIAKKYKNYKVKIFNRIFSHGCKERSQQRCRLPSPLSNSRMAKDWPYPHEEP